MLEGPLRPLSTAPGRRACRQAGARECGVADLSKLAAAMALGALVPACGREGADGLQRPLDGSTARGEGAAGRPISPVGPEERYLRAFRASRYGDALAAADEALVAAPDDGRFLTYRAAALTMLGRHEEAVNGFRLGSHRAPPGFLDKTLLFLRARSLCRVRAYGRARRVLDALNMLFPGSRLAERGQRLAVDIESGLPAEPSRAVLNWYANAGLSAQAVGRTGLAIEYLEEYLLLAGGRLAGRGRAERDADELRVRMALGAAYSGIGAFRSALEHLREVPPDHSDHRAGLFLAMALYAEGEEAEATSALRSVISGTSSPSVRERAEGLLERWSRAAEGAD